MVLISVLFACSICSVFLCKHVRKTWKNLKELSSAGIKRYDEAMLWSINQHRQELDNLLTYKVEGAL